MSAAAREWMDHVAARNKVEVAKARAKARRSDMGQPTFDWTGGGAAPMAARPLTQEQEDLRDSPLGMTLGLYR